MGLLLISLFLGIACILYLNFGRTRYEGIIIGFLSLIVTTFLVVGISMLVINIDNEFFRWLSRRESCETHIRNFDNYCQYEKLNAINPSIYIHMGLQILRKLKIYNGFEGLEIHILDEFNFIIEILSDKDVPFKSASNYLENHNFSYFSVLALKDKIYVRQITDKKSVSKVTLLKKVYIDEKTE